MPVSKSRKNKKERNKPERTDAQKMAIGARMLPKLLLLAAKEGEEPMPEQEPFALIFIELKHIKLSTFIQAIVHKDYSGLVIAGEPSEKQLTEAWEQILTAYYETTANNTATGHNKLTVEIAGYTAHITSVKMLLDGIRHVMGFSVYSVGERIELLQLMFEKLAESGYVYEYTAETIDHDLKMIENELVNWEVKLTTAQKDLANLQEQGGSKTELSEDFFLEQLAELRKFEGYPTPPARLAEEMTVYDYCLAMKRYNAHVERMNKQQIQEDGTR